MDLSICILTYNQAELLRQCVASCVSEIARAKIFSEIIIIDNASIDGGPQKVAHLFPVVRIIHNEENLGFSAANNKAIRMSQGRSVLILNDDAVLQEGSLELMLRKLASGSDIGAVGPKLLNPDGSLQEGFTHKRFPHLRGVLCEFLPLNRLLYKNRLIRDFLTLWKDGERSGETDQLAAACLMARRGALEAIGLFDEKFRYWFEDADLCYRLKKAGWRIIYLAEAKVTHYGSASINTLSRSDRNTMLFESLTYFFKKHSNPAKYFLVRLTLGLFLMLRIPAAALFKICRGSTRQEWSDSVRASVRAVRVLLLEWH